MTNDQLTRAERIRLESLAQAIGFNAAQDGGSTIRTSPPLNKILKDAETIEAWLRSAKEDA